MKKSELRQLIKEEINKVLKEDESTSVTDLIDRAYDLEVDMMDPRNKYGDLWQEEIADPLTRKYKGHFENWIENDFDEISKLINKFEILNKEYLAKLK
jgi:hypothetical protein